MTQVTLIRHVLKWILVIFWFEKFDFLYFEKLIHLHHRLQPVTCMFLFSSWKDSKITQKRKYFHMYFLVLRIQNKQIKVLLLINFDSFFKYSLCFIGSVMQYINEAWKKLLALTVWHRPCSLAECQVKVPTPEPAKQGAQGWVHWKAEQGSERMTTDTSLPHLLFLAGPNTRAGSAGTNCWMFLLNTLELKNDNTWTLAWKPFATGNRYCTLLLWFWHLISHVLGALEEALLCPAPFVIRMRKKVKQDREMINKETIQ